MNNMLPVDFLSRMEKMLGNEYRAFLDSYENNKYQALRWNPLKDRKEVFLEKNLFAKFPVPWEENGFYYDLEDRPGKHPYHEAGLYYIQEPSAMAPVHYLEPKPGEIILDLCAAPGGKSTQIGAKMDGRGILFSNEIHPTRAKILSENIERMGIYNAIVLNETPERLSERFPQFFDKILVDAPCSGEGMFRKNDEAAKEWSLENVELCANRQDTILDNAAKMLKMGGRIVFSTCTFAKQENEGSIQRFLERHKEFSVKDVKVFEGMEKNEYGVRLWPHKVKGEGHFLSVLERTEENTERMEDGLYRMEIGHSIKEYKELQEFYEESGILRKEEVDFLGGTYITFGEQLYLLPKGAPELRKLKVLRPGLHVATIKKGRIEPAHALSHILKEGEIKNAVSLDKASLDIRQYLNGQTLNVNCDKGWTLVCVDGYGIGWGKVSNGILKNHYPKGLRSLSV